jgi:hypothetical protein
MFSTLLGALPTRPGRPPVREDGDDVLVDDVRALCDTGLELVSDGAGPSSPELPSEVVVARWVTAAGASSVPVKASLLGPYAAARLAGRSPGDQVDAVRETIAGLANAGCALVEIAEPDAASIVRDPSEAARFRDAHRRLTDGISGVHLSLALTGGAVDDVPEAVLFDPAYASYAFDLIADPDNWRVIARAPADRGIVLGALAMTPGADRSVEILVWAARYAASTNGRGLARVGLADAPTRPAPSRAEALSGLAIVAEASRLASIEDPEAVARSLDPRAVDARSAAVGRPTPGRRRRS